MSKTKDLTKPFRQVFEIRRDGGTTVNDSGEHVESWSTIDTVRGALEWTSGAEVTQAGGTKGLRQGKVTIRYYSGLTGKDRLRLKDTTRELHIEQVMTPDELPHLMELTVTERTD